MVTLSSHPFRQTRKLHATLTAALALLILVLVAAMAVLMVDDWRKHRFSRDIATINRAADLLLNSAGQWAIERGLANTALHTPAAASHSLLEALDAHRMKADRTFLEAIDLIRQEPIFRLRQGPVADLQAAYEAVRTLRDEVDEALSIPRDQRSEPILDDWFRVMTELIGQARRLSLVTSHLFSGNELLFNLLNLRDSAWAMSEFAGRERAILGGLIAESAYPDDATRRLLLNYEGRIQAYWELVELIAADRQAPAELQQAFVAVEETYFGDFQQLRAEVYEAMTTRAPYPLDGQAWMIQATTAINSILDIERTAGRVAARHADAMAETSASRRSLNATVMLVPALIGLGIAVFFFFRVIQPLQVIGRTMLHLAGGGSDLDIPYTDRRDEIGVMANAIAAFKQFTNERLRLQREVERRQRIESDLRRAKIGAELANQAKSEFLANMSHELRTPLNAINGFSELLVMGYGGNLNDRQRRYLQDINAAGNHLLALIDDVLDISKVESGKLECDLVPVELPDAIAQSVRMVREKARSGGVCLEVEVPADLPRILGDQRMVRQMLTNLLTNSVKFTPRGGRITLRARGDATGVSVQVIDTGIGMAPEDIPKALSLFGQVHNTVKGVPEGTGLGLPLVKRLIELHKGSLQLESTPGEGTTATLRFQVEEACRCGRVGQPGQ